MTYRKSYVDDLQVAAKSLSKETMGNIRSCYKTLKLKWCAGVGALFSSFTQQNSCSQRSTFLFSLNREETWWRWDHGSCELPYPANIKILAGHSDCSVKFTKVTRWGRKWCLVIKVHPFSEKWCLAYSRPQAQSSWSAMLHTPEQKLPSDFLFMSSDSFLKVGPSNDQSFTDWNNEKLAGVHEFKQMNTTSLK